MPDILLTRGDEEAPSRREGEKPDCLGAPLRHVLDVQRLKKAVVVALWLATPNVPTVRSFRGRVAQAVERPEIRFARVEGDSETTVGRGCVWGYAGLVTHA